MAQFYVNNNIDITYIQKEMERLREIGKQKMIESYSKDDELRSLQIQLRKMGDSSVLGFDTVIEDEIGPEKIVDEEKEVVRDYQDFVGENAEGDEVEQDYVAWNE